MKEDAKRDEAALFTRLPNPDVREELVLRHRPLALYLARRFSGRGEALEDLEQVASLALLKAIDRFDVERDVRFATFATVTIVGELKRHLRDRGWAVRVPRPLQELAVRVSGLLPELWQDLGRSPTVAEIAERADATEEETLEALEAAQAYSTDPIDAPMGDQGVAPADALGEHDDRFERLEGWRTVAPLIGELPERERRILYLRFFGERTQSEIAQELGISQMHVSRLLARTLERLREASTD